jgi:hypothetical protein
MAFFNNTAKRIEYYDGGSSAVRRASTPSPSPDQEQKRLGRPLRSDSGNTLRTPTPEIDKGNPPGALRSEASGN